MLGRLLRESRCAAGMSQREVAKLLGRTQAYIWKIESGVQHIDIATLFDLAKIIDQTPEDLISKLRSELPISRS